MKTRLEKVEGGFTEVRFYEVYLDGKERRRACKGAKGRQPTGKARYYVLVDNRTYDYHQGGCDAYGPFTVPDIFRRDDGSSLTDNEPGCEPGQMMYFIFGARDAFAVNVRRVGARYMPDDWFKALLDTGWFKVVNGVLHDVIEDR